MALKSSSTTPEQQFNIGETRYDNRYKNLTVEGGEDDDISSRSGDLEIQKK
jgi:hypothetical protein